LFFKKQKPKTVFKRKIEKTVTIKKETEKEKTKAPYMRIYEAFVLNYSTMAT
jgi:hypothetical protein